MDDSKPSLGVGKTPLPVGQVRVALLVESSRVYGRGLLRGVAQYARTHGRWTTFIEPRGPRDSLPRWLDDWDGDAVIARIETAEMSRQIARLGLPTVDLRGLQFDASVPLIETDESAVARLAFDHLRDRGFEQFGFVGFVDHNYSDNRCAKLQALTASEGFACQVYQTPAHLRAAASWDEVQHGLVCEDDLPNWLAGLPKPIGIMACNDVRGQQVLNACRTAGVAVPDDVAVVGVDNDEVLCELSRPPLTSVQPDTQRIGYEAAALIDAMLAGQSPPAEPTFIKPVGVATRQSTDVLAIEDRQIAAAVKFIRDHACDGIQVDDVVAAVPLSRSSLERRFRRAMRRSPHEQIARVRIARVKQLLVETDLSLAVIARMTGFNYSEYLTVSFKREVGVNPSHYRKEHAVQSQPVD